MKLVTYPWDEGRTLTEEVLEEQRRQAHQRRLEFAREVQLQTGPILGPGIDGVLWNQMRPTEANETGSPPTPILSILECTLKPDVDLHDDFKPPRQLLDAVLTYISSLPGCDAIEWGLRLDSDHYASPPSLFCMVYWDSVWAWWTFQHSPGFIPFLGLLASDISNRCAKLGVSDAPRLGDIQPGVVVVDVITVTFDAEDVPSPDSRFAFRKNWEALIGPVSSEHGDGFRYSYAVWLENNVTTLPEPTPSETAVGNKFTTFTAFLAWNAEGYNGHRAAELCDNLRGLLASSCPTLPTISRKAIRFINEIRQEDHDPSQQPVGPYSLASILETNFPRKCSPNIPSLDYHYNDILSRSIRDAQTRRRPFPAPRGMSLLVVGSQGSMFEGSTTQIPLFHDGRPPAAGDHFLDVVWMQLTYRTRRAEASRIYDQLNDEISVLPGCVKVYWARDPDHKKKFSILTGQKMLHSQHQPTV